jgi:hypothetical protein
MNAKDIGRARADARSSHLGLLAEFSSALPRSEREAFCRASRRLWPWKYFSPWREGKAPTVVFASASGRQAGSLSFIPVRMRVGRQQVRIHWIVDLIVAARRRRSGLTGSLLVDWAQRHLKNVMTLGVTMTARPLYSWLGFRERTGIEYWQGSLPGAGACGTLGLQAVRVNRFPKEIDEFYLKACVAYDASVVRDSRYLNWRYCDIPFPSGTYQKYILSDGSSLRGVLVLRACRGGGAIKELFVPRDDFRALKSGLAHATRLLRELGARWVRILIDEKCPGWVAALRECGFLPSFSAPGFYFYGIEAPLEGPIHISSGDSDLDLVWM